MAKGVVSTTFAWGCQALTALCELAVNRCIEGEDNSAFYGFQASCHLRLLQRQTLPVCSESCVGRPCVLMNCVGQGRLVAAVPLSSR